MTSRFRVSVVSLAARLALVAAGLLVAIVLIEGLLRLWPSLMPEGAQVAAIRNNTRGPRHPVYIAHPYIGYVHRPNAQEVVVDGRADFSYRTDGLGFRNPEPRPTRPEVVAVGDSMTFGWGVEEEAMWTSHLRAALPGGGVLNLGLSGAAPQQYLRIFETMASGLRPKVVLIGLFPGNDLKDAPEFDAWVRSGVGGSYLLWLFNRVATPGPMLFVIRQVRKSYLVALVLDLLRSSRSSYGGGVREMSLADGGRVLLLPRLLEEVARLARPDTAEFRLTLEALQGLSAKAAEQGARAIVVVFPTKEETYLPLLDARYPAEPSRPLLDALTARGIPYLDLGPAFRARAATGQRLFFERDGHPTATGHAVVAQVILAHLRTNGQQFGLRLAAQGDAIVAPTR